MAYVDTHFHIWELDRFDYSWPTKDDKTLFKNFQIEELEEAVKATPVKYAVFVQCLNNKPEEAKWVMELAKNHSIIKGVVAGLDLTSSDLPKVLDDMQQNQLFKGCRHILDFEDEKWITREDVFQGLKVLEDRGLTFDLLLRPHLLKYIPDLIRRLPKLKFVVDHIAKPYAKDGKMSPWKEEIASIAEFPNVWCKISGLVNEGDLINWKKEDFQPYVDHVIRCFGIDRCMYGSDWPVCSQAGCKYVDVYSLLNDLLPSLSDEDKEKMFKENGRKFYSLQL
ncbi:L-fucono-1,5-lactonase-like [Mytilus edulis]|uniref:Amidohydrolase-related domain-containing protein n=1 Tax=Mytilus edulis TaxID=6550 RepID=A0A8S3S2D4_MYTED|nr:unnamed protein product [Mytilus edulis]